MLENISQYWLEFITIATVHFLAVASPGPDLAVVLKHCISYGRRAAIWTSIGIGAGILIHVIYSLLGIGILIKTTPWLFNALSLVAAAYLIYLGWGALRSKPPSAQESEEQLESNYVNITDKKAFFVGLVTNGLNPKATMFFLSVFAVAVSIDTPLAVKAVYGIYLAVATGVWFCLMSFILSTKRVRQTFKSKGYLFDRVMGIVLIALAVKLISSL